MKTWLFKLQSSTGILIKWTQRPLVKRIQNEVECAVSARHLIEWIGVKKKVWYLWEVISHCLIFHIWFLVIQSWFLTLGKVVVTRRKLNLGWGEIWTFRVTCLPPGKNDLFLNLRSPKTNHLYRSKYLHVPLESTPRRFIEQCSASWARMACWWFRIVRGRYSSGGQPKTRVPVD